MRISPRRVLFSSIAVVALCLSGVTVANASVLPEEPSAELQALAGVLQLSSRSVTATVTLPGGFTIDHPVQLSVLAPQLPGIPMPYHPVKGATAKLNLPAGHGEIRTEHLTVRLTETTDVGTATIDVPWTVEVHPLFDVSIGDVRIFPTCLPKESHNPPPNQPKLDVVVGVVNPDGAQEVETIRIYAGPSSETIVSARSYSAIDINHKLIKPSVEWYTFPHGSSSLFAFPHTTQPLDESTTVVQQTLPDLGGSMCAMEATYTFSSRAVTN